jgi:hypothetical protein
MKVFCDIHIIEENKGGADGVTLNRLVLEGLTVETPEKS